MKNVTSISKITDSFGGRYLLARNDPTWTVYDNFAAPGDSASYTVTLAAAPSQVINTGDDFLFTVTTESATRPTVFNSGSTATTLTLTPGTTASSSGGTATHAPNRANFIANRAGGLALMWRLAQNPAPLTIPLTGLVRRRRQHLHAVYHRQQPRLSRLAVWHCVPATCTDEYMCPTSEFTTATSADKSWNGYIVRRQGRKSVTTTRTCLVAVKDGQATVVALRSSESTRWLDIGQVLNSDGKPTGLLQLRHARRRAVSRRVKDRDNGDRHDPFAARYRHSGEGRLRRRPARPGRIHARRQHGDPITSPFKAAWSNKYFAFVAQHAAALVVGNSATDMLISTDLGLTWKPCQATGALPSNWPHLPVGGGAITSLGNPLFKY